MRRLLGLLLLATAVAPSVQAQVTPTQLYPLGVGSHWVYQYRNTDQSGQSNPQTTIREGYTDRLVVADTTLDGETWAVVRTISLDAAGVPTGTLYVVERVLAATNVVEQRPLVCNGCATRTITLPDSTAPETIAVGNVTYTVDGAGRTYDGMDGGVIWREAITLYASGIGFVSYEETGHSSGNHNWGYSTRLVYAEVGGRVYGANPVAMAPGPQEAGALAVGVAPNPSHGAVALRLTLPEAGAARVEAYDVTGRRVYGAGLGVQPAGAREVALDASAWAPGVYVVRVTTGDGRAASARLVRSSE